MGAWRWRTPCGPPHESELAAIPYLYEVLRKLGTFAFVVSHLFSAGRQDSSAVAELIRLITRLEELHTEVQGIISSPRLATTLLLDVSWQWSLYLKMCMAMSESESLNALGCQVPFLLKPILYELEGGRYVGPIPPTVF